MVDIEKKVIDLKRPRESEHANKMSRSVDTAYTAISNAILKGDLRSGDSLTEKDLAERIGLSRTPIREALGRLRAEGLVVLESYRKNYVAHFTVEDAEEIFELRSVLEGYAAGRAAKRISIEQLERLNELEDEMERLLDEKGAACRDAWTPLNIEFHTIIMQAANRPRLLKIVDTTLKVPQMAPSHVKGNMEDYLRRACGHHREIIAALKAKDPEWSSSQMRSHLHSFIPSESDI